MNATNAAIALTLTCTAACGDNEQVLTDPADLDHDGIKADPCIAPASDPGDDCPFSAGAVDSDGDGIADSCDPLPSIAGDRLRCVMAFSDAGLNASLWIPRAGNPWVTSPSSYPPGFQLRTQSASTIIASAILEAPTINEYDLWFDSSGLFTFYLRANAEPSESDVACSLRSTVISYSQAEHELSITQGETTLATSSVMAAAAHVYNGRMTVVIEPTASGASVRCSLHGTLNVGDAPVGITLPTQRADVANSSGNVGFGADSNAGLQLLAIYDRDDAPPL